MRPSPDGLRNPPHGVPVWQKGAAGRRHATVVAGTIPANSGENSMSSQLAYTIGEACEIARTGRTVLYQAIRSGALRAVKRGRRTLLLPGDLRDWVEGLPAIEAKATDQRNKGGSHGRLKARDARPGSAG
jgi:excisionase family DNA binding protein